MTDPIFDGDDEGNTALAPEEKEALIPSWIATRADLNRAEFDNIAKAQKWGAGRRRDILDFDTLVALHEQMFGRVWRWAGEFRKTDKNIGVDPSRIGMDLHALLEEIRYWVANQTWPPDELMARFHHRLVQIHPFPNGNGRHARMAADMLATKLGVAPLTWGRADLVEPGETRRRYITALKAADRHDMGPLLTFARG
ncbi:mobile mystery protein B [uncultured Brevundimonas sp.]|uniref:mobile mystery protein B n=1 Tax=uncultured Brevundimonas sp. TaxID=213418 RepID=UPI0026084E27|nr:mobile mystery protein B [uncultured Brevundimonas sp.]